MCTDRLLLPKTNGEMNLPAMVQILSAGAILYNRGTSYMSIARHFFPARVHAININIKCRLTLQYNIIALIIRPVDSLTGSEKEVSVFTN